MTKHLYRFGSCLCLTLALAFAPACGGGGGGGSSPEGELAIADTAIEVSPATIDAGDQMLVKVFVSQVRNDGVLLKVRFPIGLSYRRASSFIVVDGVSLDVDPNFQETSGGFNYLVFDFSRALFGESNFGEVRVTLDGVGPVTSGKVEVDPDLNDQSLLPSQKFDAGVPQFDAEDSEDVIVRDTTPTATPAPSPTPTGAAEES
jgi:hypothetical protein